MAWQDGDQIDTSEWASAEDFFAANKGEEIYTGPTHIFLRTEDGQIYAVNQQDTQQIQSNINQKKQWPKTVEAKNKENQITSLEMVATLFKSGYKAVAPNTIASKLGGWKDKFSSIKQMAEETVNKASAQVSKATSEVSKAASEMSKATSEVSKAASEVSEGVQKSGWKDKLTSLKDKAESIGLKDKLSSLKDKAEGLGLKEKFSELKTKAEAGIEKAGEQLNKAGAEVKKATEEVSKAVPKMSPAAKAREAEQVLTGEAALQRLQNQLAEFQADVKAIRTLSTAQESEEQKQLAAALDYLIQKIRALPPK